ncbi:serine/threonine-protein kinase [Microbacterium sp.]|uniref:serine/threonine-protein kinase n=1 Tax=Microbacterium sp. TaxID=51671 RepID=UPI00261BA89B|nr:serine/threonine-protein kinase [Microbacterium sp.]MCV0334312.1 protein kinase [Microbacterium sp.]MCV0376138.1 protein kinase [Microbacterium sp.]MCV0390062.1 protein kinase [Microbacterium sp.]MCV0417797.1 protein kinase [Microbacterium sp.]MCV0422535.1 protein kinase [Microbacterium sp.]
MTRRPSPPPDLPGFTYVEPLGTGGFADVFLYEQEMPRRRVAVKVLLADRISSGAAQEFADEANVMAMLSTHPAIVTIYQAGVAGDGRPYLVMEYCPRPNLQLRARKDPFSVAEALRVGVQVAGAVETAHRAGVLHRDIKPANILVTEYNRPALTDFGIASTTGATGEASGMSIPWSPPESFAEPPQSGPRTDVWALGATLYTLLAGRSPFERPGERNSSADLIERIERAALPSLKRPDSPESLQRLLERSMAKNPDDRFPSAVAFARALQKVQIELSHSVTPIDIVDDHPPAEDLDDDGDGLTRVREIVSIDPDMASFTRPSATTQRKEPPAALQGVPRFDAPAAQEAAVEQTQLRTPSPVPAPPTVPGADDRTIARAPMVVAPDAAVPPTMVPGVPVEAPVAPEPPRSRKGLWITLAAAGVVLVIGGIVGLNLLVAGIAPEPQETAEAVDPKDVGTDVVPKVTELAGTRQGEQVVFTWTNPSPLDGDSYIWTPVAVSGEVDPQQTPDPTATVPAAAGTVCIDVMLRRDDGRASETVRGCVE